ncbi:expressed unknown protein [Seminavis robusta]|uniref:Uncharacterized protein n=1 Tax=Seminavis robusta TaxID=568900 RepID=A0A9N8H4L6_9STRA|nr:expressed unknown protein [Seminavis robusta]|eukprot:Sro118_g057660.1 n/a (178) ;mRNA; r:25190-25807
MPYPFMDYFDELTIEEQQELQDVIDAAVEAQGNEEEEEEEEEFQDEVNSRKRARDEENDECLDYEHPDYRDEKRRKVEITLAMMTRSDWVPHLEKWMHRVQKVHLAGLTEEQIEYVFSIAEQEYEKKVEDQELCVLEMMETVKKTIRKGQFKNQNEWLEPLGWEALSAMDKVWGLYF